MSEGWSQATEPEEMSEAEWLAIARAGCGFDFLYDPEEDIHAPVDGRPFDRER